MELNYDIIEKEKSNILLKITVKEKEIQDEYNKIINEIKKDAQIDGFRKGKVPSTILEKKFKKEILADVSSKIIENSLKEVLEKVEKKPISY
jgi:trigger factor